MNFLKKDFIFQDVKKIKGVGEKLSKYLRKKRIEKKLNGVPLIQIKILTR